MNIKTKISSIVIASVIAAMVIGINYFAFGQSITKNQTDTSNTTSSTPLTQLPIIVVVYVVMLNRRIWVQRLSLSCQEMKMLL